jgi:hypothetical protein
VLEYLEGRPEFDVAELHALLLSRCLDIFLARKIGIDFPDLSSSFSRYASIFWMDHCLKCDAQVRKKRVSPKLRAFFFDGLDKAAGFRAWESQIPWGSIDRQAKETDKSTYNSHWF